MDATVTRRRTPVLHRVFSRRRLEDGLVLAPSLPARAAEAMALGLLGGWLETAVILIHHAAVGTVTKVSVSISRDQIPLGMLAHLAIGGVWLAVAVAASWRRRRSRLAEPALAGLGWFLMLSSALLAVEELAWWGSLTVAAGTSVHLGPWWVRHRGAVLRRGLIPLGAASTVLVAVGLARSWGAEARALTALPAARPGSPNVVLLVMDTVRADHLSIYGYARRTTPRLEALADRSILFENARSAASWTLPAHASMFTGRWPHELSVDYDRPLDGRFPTLAEFLAEHGYATGGFVANTFYCNGLFGVDRGFAHYEDAPENREPSVQQALRSAALGRSTMPLAVWAGAWPTNGDFPRRKPASQINSDALTWLDGVRDRPFFLFLNYIDAHGPYVIPEDFPRSFSKLTNQEVRNVNETALRKANDFRLPKSERQALLESLARDGLDAYDDCIRYIDEQIACLLGELERRGLAEDTWVILTADHGEHFGEHGKFWHGNSLYRSLVDVPLVIVPPRGAAGHRVATPVSPRDLPATIADLAGLSTSSPFPGESLRPLWEGGRAERARLSPLSELKLRPNEGDPRKISAADRYRTAVLDDDRVYHGSPIGPEELYDAGDREESRDLASDPGEATTLDRLRTVTDRLLDAGE